MSIEVRKWLRAHGADHKTTIQFVYSALMESCGDFHGPNTTTRQKVKFADKAVAGYYSLYAKNGETPQEDEK